MGCVYLATNRLNGKQYVGQTTGPLRTRIGRHICDSRTGRAYAFHRALAKYGPDAFEWIVLHEANDLETLNRLEMTEVAARGTKVPRGYNHTDGGDGQAGRQWRPESLSKLSKAHTGKSLSAAHRAAIGRALTGKTVNANVRAALAKGHLLCKTPESIAKMAQSLRGRNLPSETCRKIGDALRGRKRPAEVGRKISASKRGIATVCGERVGSSRLTAAAVLEMRHLYRTGQYRICDLARLNNVSRWTARRAVLGITWQHVAGGE